MSKILVLPSLGGLCNRLRSLTAALFTCEKLGWTLSLDWDARDSACPGGFQDLFQDIPGVLPPVREKEGVEVLDKWVWGAAHPMAFRNEYLRDMGDEEFWAGVIRHMRALKPLPELQTCIDRIKGLMGPDTVGVHIRRTDLLIWDGQFHYPVDKAGSDRLLYERLDREPGGVSGPKFFVASDNLKSMNDMIDLYGDRILLHKKLWIRGRLRETTAEDSLVDLYCLAACSRLVGTHWSSFSNYAATLTGIHTEYIAVPDYNQAPV